MIINISWCLQNWICIGILDITGWWSQGWEAFLPTNDTISEPLITFKCRRLHEHRIFTAYHAKDHTFKDVSTSFNKDGVNTRVSNQRVASCYSLPPAASVYIHASNMHALSQKLWPSSWYISSFSLWRPYKLLETRPSHSCIGYKRCSCRWKRWDPSPIGYCWNWPGGWDYNICDWVGFHWSTLDTVEQFCSSGEIASYSYKGGSAAKLLN